MSELKTLEVYGSHESIDHPHKRIRGYAAFQAEHEQLVAVFSLYMLHGGMALINSDKLLNALIIKK